MGIKRKGGSEKAGDVKYHAANAVPAGWLECNGATISRTAYAALFAAIGITYGAGDGATTFALPDLRGEFIRGYDNGRGVDSGRVYGSVQGEAVNTGGQSLTHNTTRTVAGGASTYDGMRTSANGASFSTQILAAGTETRPRNIAMTACIKY